jgi:NADH:ubiquinone oxidoreductase subunit 5 (subunit L)/multisubunit Na+/H+ antiporter MnhA subunit
MEAPVPASALIHSATLVSAGIYLFGRIPCYMLDTFFINYIALVGSFTAFYGGLIAAYQTDLKRILAYSTISHCGLLFFILTLDNYYNLFLYLHLHGWFKSFSFMCAGNIIGSSNNYQDYRRMGGSNSSLRYEQIMLTLAVINLGSLPFLVGFFNKHFLLVLFQNLNIYVVPSIFVLLASFTGIYYSTKLLHGVFYSSDKRNILLRKGNNVLFTSSPMFNNSTGSQFYNIFTLTNLLLVLSLTSLSILLFAPVTNIYTSVFSNYYQDVTSLVYINVYTLLLILAFYFNSRLSLLISIFLITLKLLYLCL